MTESLNLLYEKLHNTKTTENGIYLKLSEKKFPSLACLTLFPSLLARVFRRSVSVAAAKFVATIFRLA